MISSLTVKKIIQLARLSKNPTEKEITEFQDILQKILNLADDFKELDTSKLNTTDGWRTNNILDLREDLHIQNEEYERIKSQIINNFPQTQNGYLAVKGVFEEH
jgi:aspartyl/glutamyl-tRNA(Asn/Gln) amidotransferase C subunit